MPLYSVSEVTGYLRDVLEQDLRLQDLWVSGEVANLSRPASGHSYFTLRDGRASLRAVMFRSSLGAELLNAGAAVIVHGRVSLYPVRGELQLIVDIVQPEGVGELEMRLQELSLKLQNEGLFEPSRKRPLPEFPRRVGVVTSPTGAVWGDIQTVVARRYPLAELVLAPAKVQGEDAASTIVDALYALSGAEGIDVTIVARGGGSLEDLWPFNEETVARAIYAAKEPIISAVGHESDTTIADLVADHRAPTPSAGAEMAVPDRNELASRVQAYRQILDDRVAGLVRGGSDAVAQLEARLSRGGPDLDSLRQKIDDLLAAAAKELRRNVVSRTERLAALSDRLAALSPRDTLRRGYAIVQAGAGSTALTDGRQLAIGDPVQVTLARGGFDAEVISTRVEDDASSTDGVRASEPVKEHTGR